MLDTVGLLAFLPAPGIGGNQIDIDENEAVAIFRVGNGVYLPADWENRLTGSGLMTPVA